MSDRTRNNLLAVYLIGIGTLAIVTVGFVGYQEWGNAAAAASSLALWTTTPVVGGLVVAWVMEPARHTDESMVFSDEEMRFLSGSEHRNEPTMLEQGFVVSPEDLDGTEAP